MDDELKKTEEEVLLHAVRRINGRVLGTVFGLLGGLLIFTATLWLVIKGGDNVGQHLSLLNQFFPGYSVTYIGSIIGFLYGCITGYVFGWSLGWIYNRLVRIGG